MSAMGTIEREVFVGLANRLRGPWQRNRAYWLGRIAIAAEREAEAALAGGRRDEAVMLVAWASRFRVERRGLLKR